MPNLPMKVALATVVTTAGLSLLNVVSANAALIKVDIVGELEDSRTFTSSFTYDTAASDVFAAFDRGIYLLPEPATVNLSDGTTLTAVDLGTDSLFIEPSRVDIFFQEGPLDFSLFFELPNYVDADLPPQLSDFAGATFFTGSLDDFSTFEFVEVASATFKATQVPEPASLLGFFTLGTVAAGLSVKKKALK